MGGDLPFLSALLEHMLSGWLCIILFVNLAYFPCVIKSQNNFFCLLYFITMAVPSF